MQAERSFKNKTLHNSLRIGIDLMGSDSSPELIFEAVLTAAKDMPATTLVAIGTHAFLKNKNRIQNVELHAVADAIGMADEPLRAIARKQSSSLFVGLKLLSKQKIDAFISAGNTGALVAGATLRLPRLTGIKRPALLTVLPTSQAPLAVIDVGGSVFCKPPQLVQFALMGAAYQSCRQNLTMPKVGLLNIGIEPKKGTSSMQETYQLLQQISSVEKPPFKFVGNIEGRDVFSGQIDVLVTDGFTGNVFLKTSEGVSAFIMDQLRPTDQKITQRFSYTEYPGALICGVDGIVIKCHGQATRSAIVNSIKETLFLLEHQLISKIHQKLKSQNL